VFFSCLQKEIYLVVRLWTSGFLVQFEWIYLDKY
jgi:hypothetical protein